MKVIVRTETGFVRPFSSTVTAFAPFVVSSSLTTQVTCPRTIRTRASPRVLP